MTQVLSHCTLQSPPPRAPLRRYSSAGCPGCCPTGQLLTPRLRQSCCCFRRALLCLLSSTMMQCTCHRCACIVQPPSWSGALLASMQIPGRNTRHRQCRLDLNVSPHAEGPSVFFGEHPLDTAAGVAPPMHVPQCTVQSKQATECLLQGCVYLAYVSKRRTPPSTSSYPHHLLCVAVCCCVCLVPRMCTGRSASWRRWCAVVAGQRALLRGCASCHARSWSRRQPRVTGGGCCLACHGVTVRSGNTNA